MDRIVIRGARQHNLKDIDLQIPRGRLTVITGLSGSGKSSLAFDTLYAEGQRRYVESLSAHARQFLERMDKPDVDLIEGLSPAIAIEQKTAGRNPRSTVGTISEIYDYLRVLFARVGRVHCPRCGGEIRSLTVQEIVDRILELPEQTRILINAPLVHQAPGRHRRLLSHLRRQGFVRVRVDRQVLNLDQPLELQAHQPHDIEVVVDRLSVRPDARRRLTDSVELALRIGDGRIRAAPLDGDEWDFSERPLCHSCDLALPEVSPRLFSFNCAQGACPACSGLGTTDALDPEAATAPVTCKACGGSRLRPEALAVTVGNLNIHQVSLLDMEALHHWIHELHFSPREKPVAERLLGQITQKLQFLFQVGLPYLSLNRPAPSLAGGEAQRLRLATQLGSRLVGVLYILDEPSIGLHQRDNQRLIQSLKELRDLGNTVLVVEHDPEFIMAADRVVDMGPGAGVQGGHLIFCGSPQSLLQHPDSLTGRYLSGKLNIPVPKQRRKSSRGFLTIEGATAHNLTDITAAIPVGLFTCVTGVSGSGKSTLVLETLYRAAAWQLHRARETPGPYRRIRGLEAFDNVVHVDQTSIGRTPRSNPATYTGVFTPIRSLFSQVPEARARGYTASRFSFNVKGGRCEACGGDGTVRVEMHFLPDIYVTCDACSGRRFNRDTLEIKYKGLSVAEVLDMTIDEAHRFFGSVPVIRNKLATLQEVGLGYLGLGQAATTLSGGEAQRIKLARELGKRGSGRSLYILDEPTTGLHFEDIKRLLDVLNRLVDAGNTVVVIEHHLDVIKTADFVIELGPDAGKEGGRIVGSGTPEQIAALEESHTGGYLRRVLGIG